MATRKRARPANRRPVRAGKSLAATAGELDVKKITREVQREVKKRSEERARKASTPPRPETVYMDGGPRLLNSFCAALDVLGFSAHTRKSFQASLEKGVKLFLSLYGAITDAARAVTDDPFEDLARNLPPSWTHKFFTDNLMLAFAVTPSEGRGEDEFGDVLLDIVDYQLTMALHGFFVRGGIAYGPLHVSNHVVFGPALLDAHEIEKSVAKNPRVVLSRQVVKIAKVHLRFYHPPTSSPHNRYLLVADDRRVFVNYLAGVIVDPYVRWDMLRQHRESISRALDENRRNRKVRPKYVWLAGYHDWFCRSLAQYSGYDPGLLLKRTRPRLEFGRFATPARTRRPRRRVAADRS